MKGTRNNLRTFGHNRQKTSFSLDQMDLKNLNRISPIKAGDIIEDMTPWERLRDSFSRNPALNNKPQNHMEIHQAENQNRGWIPCTKTSSTATQVNMFHCGDCRTHIKYGKQINQEKSESESDIETSNTESNCITCKPACAKILICENIKEEEECSRNTEKNLEEDGNCNPKSTDIVLEADKLNANRIPDVLKQALTDDEKEKVLTPEVHKDETLEKVVHLSCGSDYQTLDIRRFNIF